MSNVFSPDQRNALTELGFVFSADLVSEVAYAKDYMRDNTYIVLVPDGLPYIMENVSDPEIALGMY